MGLAMVYGIIKGHEGMINVDSEPGQGTTCTFYLPAADKKNVEEQTISTEVLKWTETILLVDDEKSVFEVSRDMLESLGYQGYTIGNGQEAVTVYMEKLNEIDLIILDMIMPGISGDKTFDRLKDINPQLKVILPSGYTVNGQTHEILDRGCMGFLQKPFHLRDLSDKVRLVLDN